MRTTRAGYVTQFLALFAFWLLLSGDLRPLFLAMGAASALLVVWLTHDLVTETFGGQVPHGGRWPHRIWRFVVYLGWMLARIFVASLQVAYFALHPRPPLDPALLRFRTGLQSRFARVMLANSITLIPGTLTLSLTDDELLVHVLIPRAADDLLDATMQNLVGSIFREEPQPAPTVTWERGSEVTR